MTYNNYRGICLLPKLNRIISKILAAGIGILPEEMKLLDENQAVFRKSCSTTDAIQFLYMHSRRFNHVTECTRQTKSTNSQ